MEEYLSDVQNVTGSIPVRPTIWESAMEITLFIGLILFSIAFLCEYTDSTLGMGYGTTMTPILLLMGFEPLDGFEKYC